jgi:phospholipase C
MVGRGIWSWPAALAAVPLLLATCSPNPQATGPAGIHKIEHVVVIMQENRSFDHYFGTFPGADGIPMKDGVPTVCNPDPSTAQCVKPYHDSNDRNTGGPHTQPAMRDQINNGRMDGFITAAQRANTTCDVINPACRAGGGGESDVMAYHDDREIPNYWAYAKNFVLQDHMFQPAASWSLTEHLYMVSGWSARCSRAGDPSSCADDGNLDAHLGQTRDTQDRSAQRPLYDFAWTDLTYLLHKNHISWKYYVAEGTEPDCEDGAAACVPQTQQAGTPGSWNPLPKFDTVKLDGELANIQAVGHFYDDAKKGTLPALSWIVPNQEVSEHPPALISTGQAYVTGLVNAIMQGPNSDSTAIFLTWDDAGGLYDHMPPPAVDAAGYGLRLPGLVISPYAKKGYVDKQVLSFDAYLKFIEDDFLGGQRIDPASDGRPDPRPGVRENASILGDLTRDFDFNQPPRKPLPLAPTPRK